MCLSLVRAVQTVNKFQAHVLFLLLLSSLLFLMQYETLHCCYHLWQDDFEKKCFLNVKLNHWGFISDLGQDTWECSRCTYQNSIGVKECQICHLQLGLHNKSSWQCTNCTMFSTDPHQCETCGQPRLLETIQTGQKHNDTEEQASNNQTQEAGSKGRFEQRKNSDSSAGKMNSILH